MTEESASSAEAPGEVPPWQPPGWNVPPPDRAVPPYAAPPGWQPPPGNPAPPPYAAPPGWQPPPYAQAAGGQDGWHGAGPGVGAGPGAGAPMYPPPPTYVGGYPQPYGYQPYGGYPAPGDTNGGPSD